MSLPAQPLISEGFPEQEPHLRSIENQPWPLSQHPAICQDSYNTTSLKPRTSICPRNRPYNGRLRSLAGARCAKIALQNHYFFTKYFVLVYNFLPPPINFDVRPGMSGELPPTNKHTNQPTNEPTIQPTNQQTKSTNQPTSHGQGRQIHPPQLA